MALKQKITLGSYVTFAALVLAVFANFVSPQAAHAYKCVDPAGGTDVWDYVDSNGGINTDNPGGTCKMKHYGDPYAGAPNADGQDTCNGGKKVPHGTSCQDDLGYNEQYNGRFPPVTNTGGAIGENDLECPAGQTVKLNGPRATGSSDAGPGCYYVDSKGQFVCPANRVVHNLGKPDGCTDYRANQDADAGPTPKQEDPTHAQIQCQNAVPGNQYSGGTCYSAAQWAQKQQDQKRAQDLLNTISQQCLSITATNHPGLSQQELNRDKTLCASEIANCFASNGTAPTANNASLQQCIANAPHRNTAVDPNQSINGSQTQKVVLAKGTCGKNARTNLLTTDFIPGCNETEGLKVLGGMLKFTITVLTTLVGILAVGGVAFGALKYTGAVDGEKKSESQTREAIKIINNSLLGVALYALMIAIINWLVPGGVIG